MTERVVVGWDASSLEDRIRAHYCSPFDKDGSYTANLLNPEYSVHAENMENWPGVERPLCKNGQYALQYNCQPPRLAATLGVDKQTGLLYYNDWWERNKPLKLLKQAVEDKWEREGYILSLDGVRMKCRRKFTLLNTLMQSAGIIVMKEAMCILDGWIIDEGLDSFQIVHYHDEQMNSTIPEHAERVLELGCQSIVEAGINFNLNVPLAAAGAIGDSWKDVH